MDSKTKHRLIRMSPSFVGAIGFMVYALVFQLPIAIVALLLVFLAFLVCRVFFMPQ